MWQIVRMSPESQPVFVAAAHDLLQSTTRTIILAISGMYLAWHLIATVLWPRQLGANIWLTTVLLVPVCLIALRQLPKRPLLAQLIWQLGIAAAITLAIYLFRRPEVAFLFALLPLLAVVMLSWPAGLLAELLVLGLMWWLSRDLLFPLAYSAAVAVGGAIAGLLGWASSHTLSTVAQWSFFGFTEARQHMEEAQGHRAQLAIMLKDLDHAYYRLERANAALVAARKVAEEAERFKAEFVTNVSHELRTPLNLIVGFSEVIMTSPESYGVELPGPYRSDLNAIYRSAQHLLALVDDVLDLARIEAGKIALVREEVDLAALVAEAADTMRDYVAAKGLELRIQIAPGLPRLWIDRLRIRQVLLNLLVNAARFTERGAVGVAVSEQDGEVMLQVHDTGRGIPEQDLPKIFEEFRSTEQPVSAWHSGTGLGLPISKKFVEVHHGRMGVESVYGQGTTFWFTLPAAPTPAIERSRPQKGRWHPLVRLGAAERIVVVVHDDPRIAPLLQRHLEGYQVVGAATPEEGAALGEDIKAIALVTDASSDLPAAPGDIPVVRCPLPSSRHAAIVMGALDLLVKPVGRQDLLAAVARVGRPVRRVLVVDDEPKVARLFQRMLRSHLPIERFLEAYSGGEALEVMRAERPDLVLLDLIMPEIDGHTVLEHMAADPELAGIPVIIISAQGQDYLNVPLIGPIEVSRAAGFQLGEVVRTLEALFNALAPGWRQLVATAPAHPAVPAE